MKQVKFFCLLVLFSITILNAQIFNVKGNVSTSTEAVKNVLITFTAEDDTTKFYTTLTDSMGNYSIGLITSIEENISVLPTKFELAQNYPNPFSTSTAISYNLNKQSDVQITIYDILGREVKKYHMGEQSAGVHGILWDGKNNSGQMVTTGVYFYRLNVGKESLVNKMLLTRRIGANCNLSISGNFVPSVELKKETAIKSIAESYKVKIENTDSTQPRIAAKETNNIIVEKDTTLNFNVNKLPIANAGEDSEVKVGQYLILDGTKSAVGDGSSLNYKWTADTTNPAKITFINFDPQIYLGFVKEGIYRFSLVVNDSINNSEPDEVIITVSSRGESVFKDPVMELQARYALKDPTGELTNEKLLAIDTMVSDFGMGKVTSLEGIEYCSNLIQLTFGLNDITDLSSLSGLTKLQSLSLDQNYNIVDISPLANLTNLTKLNLERNNISDVSALKNLIKLTSLHLLGNPIEDISSFKNMKDLNDLWLGQYDRNSVPLSGISVIEGFTKLDILWITSCELTDISFIAPLTNLRLLHLRNNKLKDIQVVANCTQLVRLYLDLNEITDITPLEGLTNLSLLYLMYNQITNIEPLINNIGLGEGDYIYLTGNLLDDISINQYIPELKKRGVKIVY